MNPSQPTHLSEEAINDLLIGIDSREAAEHLSACELCRSRVDEFRAAMANFNDASLAWSEAKAIRPLPRPERPSPRLRQLGWSAATAAFLLAAGAAWNYTVNVQTQRVHITAQPEFPDPDQVAQDNQLLRNVYNALEDQPQSPVNEFSIAEGVSSSDSSTKARTQ